MREEYHLLALLDVEVYIVEENCSVLIASLQAFNLQNLVTWFTIHLEDDSRILTARRTNLLNVQLLQHLLAGCGLLTLSYIGRESADELLQLLLLLLSLHLLVLSLTESQLRTLVPERVVTGKHGYLTEVDIHGLGADSIEEVTVVRNHENCLLDVAEIFLQPLYGVEVEVVGRLIEEEVVRITEESLRQHHAYLLCIRKLTNELIVTIFLHAEVLKQLGSITLSFPTVHLSELKLQLSSEVTILFCHLWFCIEALALLHVLPQWLMAHQNGVHHAELVILEVVLLQNGKTLSWSHFYCTLVWLQIATDGTEEGRLTSTVGTDYAINITMCELEVYIFVKHSLTELNCKILYCYHSCLLNIFF